MELVYDYRRLRGSSKKLFVKIEVLKSYEALKCRRYRALAEGGGGLHTQLRATWLG